MRTRFLLRPAACSLSAALPTAGGPSCPYTAATASRHIVNLWQRPRCRFQSTGASASLAQPLDVPDSRGIRTWEKPLVSEVYRQLRGQYVEARTSHSSAAAGGGAAMGGSAPTSLPGWDFTPEDERGLRFGSAYMLLTLAWNRKFTRLRDLLVNANRAREGSKQVITRLFSVVSSTAAMLH